MNEKLRDLRVLVVVLLGAALVGGPAIAGAIADYAKNSDKVDGKDAVKSSVSSQKAASKLVAVNPSGKLPAKFIPKVDEAEHATNSDMVGGLAPDNFVLGEARLFQDETQIQGTNAVSTNVNFLDVNGFGHLLLQCSDSMNLTYITSAAPGEFVWIDDGGTNPSLDVTDTGPGGIGAQLGPKGMATPADVQIWDFDSPRATLTVLGKFDSGNPNTCRAVARLWMY